MGTVLDMHKLIAEKTGGSPYLRDASLLESALNAPFQTFGGKSLYPTLLHKAARLGHSIVSDHPFVDGNKRIGVHAMLVFLAINGVETDCTQQELIETGLSLANGTLSFEELLKWLCRHC